MIRGKEIEKQVYEPEHIQQVLAEIERNFRPYFQSFAIMHPLEFVFKKPIEKYQKEQVKYREYLDLDALDEFEHDPNAFKNHTKRNCPIVLRCLNAQDEVMKAYKISFGNVTGRQLLDAVRNISNFGISYAGSFEDEAHETANLPADLGLETLNDPAYGTLGVIGYGVQSSMLYGLYPRQFAHRSQNAVWTLYFLSGRKDFGLEDGSEFMMIHTNEGTCEQNYFYPAELFGFYSLKVYLMLKAACAEKGVQLFDWYRYIYLSRFCDHIGEQHRNDINTFRRSSEHVEQLGWY